MDIDLIYAKLDNSRTKNKRLKETLLSAYIFLTNFIFAYLMKYDIYAILFLCLFVTSILMRIEENVFTYYLDQVFLYLVIGYGAYTFFNKFLVIPFYLSLLIICTFLATAFLFFWGFKTKSYCFDKDEKTGEVYHALLHIISSIGHHLIIIS